MTSIILISALALLAAPQVQAATCYDSYYRRYYTCNNGLATGGRIGVGVGVAALVLLLLMFSLCFMRRRRQRAAMHQFNLPTSNTQSYPSTGAPNAQGYSSPFSKNQQQPQNMTYAAPPGAPPASYQPSNNQHGQNGEHGYEYQQHQDNLRQQQGAAPEYSVSQQGTGGSNQYAPPPGPPPAATGLKGMFTRSKA